MNILITSAGRRTQLVSYFKKELDGIGHVIAADLSPLAPAIYMADQYYLLPRITDENYIDQLLDVCKKESITGIFSLIDPELSILAKNKKRFEAIGVQVVGSSYENCELWLDKYNSYQFCKNLDILCAKTYIDLIDFKNAYQNKEIEFPVFIKPRKGSASLHINKVNNYSELETLFNSVDYLIIQEYMQGQELGVDAYVDMISGEVISVFIKEKLTMRAGETDKSRSIKSDKLVELVKRLLISSELRGPVDIDVFVEDGVYYISEINPRFGGGYLHAYACGVNFPKYIINNLQGIVNKKYIGIYEEDTYLLKHDTIKFIQNEKI